MASFFEEQEMPRIGMVVPQGSTLIEGYPQLPIPSNHRDMTKFSSIEDTGLVRVIGQIRAMIFQKRVNERPSDNAPQLIPGYKDCLSALSYPDMSRRYGSILPPADDTCEWLGRHPIYNQWLVSGDGIMWILGHPGTGKSTLMKYAVQKSAQSRRIYRDSSLTLSFFFYNLGSELQKSVEGMLRAVLSQILQAFPSLIGDLVIPKVSDQVFVGNQTMGMPKKSIWQSTNLIEILEESITLILKHADVWLFIDALDECRIIEEDTTVDTEEIRQLMKSFRRILRMSVSDPYKLHVCCSCRHYPHIASLNDGYKVLVENENARDIKEYITQELFSEILPDHRSLLESLVETISSKATGSFQWVRLVTQKMISMYSAGKNASKIQECVDDLPKHLSDLYGSILSSIPEDDRSRSRKLFEWACLSSEPLKLPELRLMMNIDPNRRPRSFKDLESIPEFIEDDFQMELLVQSLSGGLAGLEGTDTESSTDCSYQPQGTEGSADANNISGTLTCQNSSGFRKPKIKSLFLIHQSIKDYMMTEGFQILNGSLIPNNTLLAGAYRNMSISLALVFTIQPHTINQQHALSEYSQEALRYSDKAILSVVDQIFNMDQHEVEELVEKAMKFIETNPAECDISLLLQHISLAHFEELVDREVALAFIQNLLAWCKSYYERCGVDHKFIDDTFNYASEAKKGGMGEMEAQLISSLSNPVMQDPFVRFSIMKYACEYDLPEILYHAYTFTNGVDNYVRQIHLAQAAGAGSYNVSILLLDDSKMSSKEPFEDQGALLKASRNGHTDVVKLLVAHGANIHQTGDGIETALHWAAEFGKDEICQILLDKGAEIDARDRYGVTPFMAAARRGREAVCDILIGHSPDIDATENDGITVLTHAVRGGNTHIMSALMRGAQNWPRTVSLTESTIRQSGLEALDKDNVKFCELAIRRKGIEFLSSAGINAARAASFRAPSCLKLLLDCRQDINLTTYKDRNPLHWAARRDNVKMIIILLDRHDIDVNHIRTYPFSHTALCRLALQPRRRTEIARMLLNHRNIDPNLKSCHGTALHLAIDSHRRLENYTDKDRIYDERSEFIQLLLDHPRIDINIEDADGYTPLALVVLYGYSGIARQIFDQKSVQPGRKDPFGRTPLHLVTSGRKIVASGAPRVKIVDMLLDRTDIDINSLEIMGQTPLDLAIEAMEEAEVAYSSNDKSDGGNTDERDKEQNKGLDDDNNSGDVDTNSQESFEACESIVKRLRAHGAMCGDCIKLGNMACEIVPSTPSTTEPIGTAKTTETAETPKTAKVWGKIRASLGPPRLKELEEMMKHERR